MHNEIIDKDDNLFDLKEIVSIILQKKFFIIIFILISCIFSVFYALSLPNIYKSSAILLPSNSTESLSKQLGAGSAISSFTGFGVVKGEATKSEEALERIKSFEFFSSQFLPQIKLEDLVASIDWNHNLNKIIYDENSFDPIEKKWIRKVSYPLKKVPSNQEAYKAYKKNLSIKTDPQSSFIYISYEHHSPFISKEWLDIIINSINESMREIDKQSAIQSIEYLNSYFKNTNVQSLKDSISSLQENQMEILMLSSTTPEYVLKKIDSPIYPEFKSSPNRPLICIVISMLGSILSILAVLTNHYMRID